MKHGLSIVDNIALPNWQEILEYIEGKNFPSRDETISREWEKLEPFWSDFRPRANFSVLRNSLKLSNIFIDFTNQFIDLAKKYEYDFDIRKLLLMKCHGTVQTHVDAPYREQTLNWYAFPTNGNELIVENVSYNPKQGDLIWINTSLRHSSIHFTDDPLYIMGL